ncbi:GerW family sporulation protein [Clostridium sp. MD294]|uniref:GerW family sporulation protein n=1 Tax=Clostridium sp. MD294 TaxID=97138 RepID=UPI0002CAB6D7|nr:GerW family sporulation protein [Clostridium sp. MD294]NDO47407.1 sporulation protein [Clostridium sp. MD294]USF29522.1 hypothetical protein C820_000913 [Clostridium sp. MD294]
MGKGFDTSLNMLFDKVEDIVSTKTIVGDAITMGDLTLLPLIEVSVGVGMGTKEGPKEDSAGGMGAKITPSAVLVIQNGNVQMINIKNQDAVNKLIDMAPGIASKLNFGAIFGKRNENKQPKEEVKFEEEIVTEE